MLFETSIKEKVKTMKQKQKQEAETQEIINEAMINGREEELPRFLQHC